MVIDIRSCDMATCRQLHVMACDMSSNDTFWQVCDMCSNDTCQQVGDMGDTCWEVSDMGGETLHTGTLMCLFAQALGKVGSGQAGITVRKNIKRPW